MDPLTGNRVALPTQYGPAERVSPGEIKRQAQIFERGPLIDVLHWSPVVIMVLNHERQVVFANQEALSNLGVYGKIILGCGLRPGEVLECVHAADTLGGCGTSAFCEECGIVDGPMAANRGEATVEECRIRKIDGGVIELRVWSAPILSGGESFCLMTIQDITEEKRRVFLERLLFSEVHPKIVLARENAEAMARGKKRDCRENAWRIRSISRYVEEEISSCKDMAEAEGGRLSPDWLEIRSTDLLEELSDLFDDHPLSEGRQVLVDPDADDISLTTDPLLLRRVLTRMVVNGLEAISSAESVTLGCDAHERGVRFWVHNNGVMPGPVQLQVFQRSFSTKGVGRGVGAYAMKLIGEDILKGRVSFTSMADWGTIFQIICPLKPPSL